MELLPIGSWETIMQGDDIVIMAVGPMVYTAIKAAEKLMKDGISIEIVNCRFIKPMDIAFLENIRNKFSKVLTIEEGIINGGFGDGVAAWLLENGYKGRLKRIGLPDSFVEHGSRSQILSSLGLDVDGVVLSIKDMVKSKK